MENVQATKNDLIYIGLSFSLQKGTIYPSSKGAALSQPPAEPSPEASVSLPPALAALLANASKGETREHWLKFSNIGNFVTEYR